jgi:hypothetical protein
MTIGPHRWRKSSYSGSGPNCVELAGTLDRIRDSKHPTGPTLHIDLAGFLSKIKTGGFQR